MDQNTRDESLERRREEALARRLGEALDQIAKPGAEPCPDAEWIAAYHERALGTDETALCESHFADCSRCRKILAVLSASDDTPLAEKEVARLGELVAAAQLPGETESRQSKPIRPSSWDWRMRWLAPALGAAAVLTVWFAMRPPWGTTERRATGTLVAEAPRNESLPPAAEPPPDLVSKVSPQKQMERPSAQLSAPRNDLSASNSPPPSFAADALAKNRLDEGNSAGAVATKSGIADRVSEDQKKENGDPATTAERERVAPPVAPAAPPAPGGSLQAEVRGMTQPASPEPRALVNAPASALATPMARVAPAEKSTARDESKTTFRSAAQGVRGAFLKSPTGTATWRIGANGRIERSTDEGRTWNLQASPSQDEWLAGAAASDKIAWIGGRNGKIARTIDGERWGEIVPPPAAADTSGKFPDWISITVTGAQSATITSTDQRRFSTQDGGKSWQPLINK